MDFLLAHLPVANQPAPHALLFDVGRRVPQEGARQLPLLEGQAVDERLLIVRDDEPLEGGSQQAAGQVGAGLLALAQHVDGVAAQVRHHTGGRAELLAPTLLQCDCGLTEEKAFAIATHCTEWCFLRFIVWCISTEQRKHAFQYFDGINSIQQPAFSDKGSDAGGRLAVTYHGAICRRLARPLVRGGEEGAATPVRVALEEAVEELQGVCGRHGLDDAGLRLEAPRNLLQLVHRQPGAQNVT